MSNIVSIGKKEIGCIRCGAKNVFEKFCLDCQMKNKTVYPAPEFRLGENDQQYAYAQEAFAIGWDVIRARHSYLVDLDIRVEFVFLKNAPIKNGKEVWGRAKKITGLNAWLASENREQEMIPKPFFVLEFSYFIWTRLSVVQRIALVEHELFHCTTKEGKPSMRGHDHEEFVPVIKIHGLWTEGAKQMLKAAKEAETNPLFADETLDEATGADFEDDDEFEDEEAA